MAFSALVKVYVDVDMLSSVEKAGRGRALSNHTGKPVCVHARYASRSRSARDGYDMVATVLGKCSEEAKGGEWIQDANASGVFCKVAAASRDCTKASGGGEPPCEQKRNKRRTSSMDHHESTSASAKLATLPAIPPSCSPVAAL